MTRLRHREPFAYAERARITVRDGALRVEQQGNSTQVPTAAIASLLLGPGTSITSDAIDECSRTNTNIVYAGADGTNRFIATGRPWGNANTTAERHAQLWVTQRDQVAQGLFQLRWGTAPKSTNLRAIRGEEGQRMKQRYKALATQHQVPWDGRRTRGGSDSTNEALNWAGATVNTTAASAVHASGALPALGFLHGGGSNSFTFDIADLIRDRIHEAVFEHLALGATTNPKEIRSLCRDRLREMAAIEQCIRDIHKVLDRK